MAKDRSLRVAQLPLSRKLPLHVHVPEEAAQCRNYDGRENVDRREDHYGDEFEHHEYGHVYEYLRSAGYAVVHCVQNWSVSGETRRRADLQSCLSACPRYSG